MAADAVDPARAQSAPLTPVLASVLLALLLGLQPIATDLMLPALPALATDLHAPMAAVQLTMSGLMLAFGLSQMVWGPVSDRLGRRPVLMIGLALYMAASVGAALAGQITAVVAWRVVQGAGMSAAVVCARAMVRDLYPPHEGAMVMARAITVMGIIIIASPLAGGVLVAQWGWRAAVWAMAGAGVLLAAYMALRLPETLAHKRPEATQPGPLLRQLRATAAHPAFRAWATLVAVSYGGIFIFLAGSGFVLIRVLGLGPGVAGVVMSTTSVAYIAGTLLCRRWLPQLGLSRSVGRAAGLSLAACLSLLVLAATDSRSVWAVMAPVWLMTLGHGVHMPCGQAGAVGPFPHAAGLASALAGLITALGAFVIGLVLGQVMDDASVRPFSLVMATTTGLTALVATTLVRWHGEKVAA
jgi:DHA1 family bicyclomycin/chloramphenicol resistance-like MFS transporter